MLYLVATPIGNLEDITLRALRVLREAKLIAAEDTRTARRLLSHFDIQTPLTSYFEHNKLTKLDYLLQAAAEGDLALISEAGTPAISDPGYELVRAASERGITVTTVPGPSALLVALASSGLPTDRFVYLGFLPRRSTERRQALEQVKGERATLVFYEAPHRLLDSLDDVLAVLGDRPIAVCRELTKLHEEIVRGTVSSARDRFREPAPRGEITVVLGGASAADMPAITPAEIEERLGKARQEGLSDRDAVSQVAQELGLPRRQVYQRSLATKS